MSILRNSPIQPHEYDVDLRILYDENVLNLVNSRFNANSNQMHKIDDLTNDMQLRLIAKKLRLILNDEFYKLFTNCLSHDRYSKSKNEYGYDFDFDFLYFLTITNEGPWDGDNRTGWLAMNFAQTVSGGYIEYWGFSIKSHKDGAMDSKYDTLHIVDYQTRSKYGKISPVPASEWLPVNWTQWQPYGWQVPIPNQANSQALFLYGDHYMIPNVHHSQVCQKQISYVTYFLCFNNRREHLNVCRKWKKMFG